MKLPTGLLRLGASVSLCTLVAGCGSALVVTPASGPFSVDVVTHIPSSVPYALVKIDSDVADILNQFEPAVLAGAFTDNRPPAPVLFGIGDTVSVTIFEAAAGGLFIPIEAGVRPGNFVTLPDQTVDNDGNISVPYAGTIKAGGRTNVDVQNDIIARIRNRAIEPQIIVALSRQNSSLVSVVGAVNSATRNPAQGIGAGDRITDAITRAGGPSGPGFATWVMLERAGKRATVPFANLVFQPENNIFVQPGDRIYLYQEQQKFFAFGATGTQGEFPFDAWRINLTEAVAKAGGLLDVQADPASVFLYRREPREVARKLGVVDVERFKTELVPVIFSTSFRDPGGYFNSTKVQMRHGDVVFAANAAQVEIDKIAALASTLMGLTVQGEVTRQTIKGRR